MSAVHSRAKPISFLSPEPLPFQLPHCAVHGLQTRTSPLTRILECVRRSETSMSMLHSGTAVSLVDVQCTAESLLGELLHPVDHRALLRQALQDPSLVVVAYLPSCHTADVEGLSLGSDWLSRRLMGLKATPFELATLLGELHLLGQCVGCFVLCLACVQNEYILLWCLSMEQPTSDSQILSVTQLLQA